MYDEINRPDLTEVDDSDDPHWRIVKVVLFAIALLGASYVLMKPLGRVTSIIGSLAITLAAFAVYQWVKVWLNMRRQQRGPEDDGAPITLKIRPSKPQASDADER
jgi:hypothetical protein